MGGFVNSPPRTLEASDVEHHDDDDATASEGDDDGDASSFDVDEMST